MKLFKSIRCLLVMLVLLQGFCGMAQHYVSIDGEVDAVVTLPKLGGDSAYLVSNGLTVLPEGDLRVEAGVKIYFSQSAYLRVDGGKLLLDGHFSDSIYLRSYELSHDWAGIQLKNVASEGSVRLSYVEVVGALTAMSAANCNSINVNHCFFTNYYAGKGIELVDCKGCSVDSCFFSQCKSGIELKARNGDSEDNRFTRNIFYQGQINIELSNAGYDFKCNRNHIVNNYFEGAATAISFESVGGSSGRHASNYIEGNLISTELPHSYASYGIKAAMDSLIIRNNVFWRNDEAVRMFQACDLVFEKNTFYDNKSVLANLLDPGTASFVGNAISEANSRIVTFPSSGSKMNGNNILHYKEDAILFANASAETVDMRGNYWDTQAASEIESVILDAHDDPSLGEIVYDGYLAECDTTAPVSPPYAVKKQFVNDKWLISWDDNPESDVNQYVLFYGSFNFYKFSNHIDGIKANSYTLSSQQAENVAIVACDRAYNPFVYASVGQSAYAFATDYPYAGKDATLCAPMSGYVVDDANIPYTYNTFVWRTSGTGVFSDTLSLQPVYYPSPHDFEVGEVTLTLRVVSNGTVKMDAMKLRLFKKVSVFAGNNSFGITGSPLALDQAVVSDCDSVHWHSLGDGFFEDPSVVNTMYYPGEMDKEQGYVNLVLEAWSFCDHDTSMVHFDLFKQYVLQGRTWANGMLRPHTPVVAASFSDGNQFMSGFYRTVSDDDGAFRFDALLPDTYILYAFADTLSADAAGGYYLGDLQWNMSNMIVVDGDVYDVDIDLPAITKGFDMGEGCINGVFDYPEAAFKARDFYCRSWLRDGDAVEFCDGGLSNVGVLLLDATKQRILGFALTDATGRFSFESLPFGTYHVMADLPRYGQGLCEKIVLSPEAPCVSGLHLFVNQNGRVDMRNDDAAVIPSETSAYPNPAENEITLGGLMERMDYKVRVMNSVGVTVLTMYVQTDLTGSFTLSLADLPSGIYCVRAENQKENRLVKVVKL